MVRGKIQVKRIENATSRQVTFSKRRNGLMKKAFELSVLCEAEVAIVVFSQKGRLYEFASSSTQETLERYRKYTKQCIGNEPGISQYSQMQQLKQENETMTKKLELLEAYQRNLLGQDLCSCPFQDLQEIASQLEISLCNVRARKAQLLEEQVEQLRAKGRFLMEENANLRKKNGVNSWEALIDGNLDDVSSRCDDGASTGAKCSDVETDLFIGLPHSHSS